MNNNYTKFDDLPKEVQDKIAGDPNYAMASIGATFAKICLDNFTPVPHEIGKRTPQDFKDMYESIRHTYWESEEEEIDEPLSDKQLETVYFCLYCMMKYCGYKEKCHVEEMNRLIQEFNGKRNLRHRAEREGELMELEFHNMINEELAFAKAKHPKFCDQMTAVRPFIWRHTLGNYRALNDGRIPDPVGATAETIYMEEWAEAFVAYLEKDYDLALQELAQCGAVILRMMEFVKHEKEGK